MFAIFVIVMACALPVFGMLGWLYLDQKKNQEEVQDYFKNNFDKF